jgi:hypothetical protein
MKTTQERALERRRQKLAEIEEQMRSPIATRAPRRHEDPG